MSDQVFQNSKHLKYYKYSGLLVIVGLIFLYWSQALYFVAGNQMRLLSLVFGLGSIVAAACLRAQWRIFQHAPLVIISGFYFCVLAFLTKFQGHAIWYDRTQLIFCLVCLILFWSGYILAREKRQDFLPTDQRVLVIIAGIAIICLLAFLRYVKNISFQGSLRDFGETALNPVGVAYANTCLFLIFVILGFTNKNLIKKSIYLFAASLALGVVMSSASRGAVIWGICGIIYFLLLNRYWRSISIKNLFVALGACILVIPVILLIYNTNYAVSERMNILINRFEGMYYSFFGGGQAPVDLSTSSRQYYWYYYYSTLKEWFILGEQGYRGYPHNQWLEIFVRFGFLGLPLFFTSIFLFIRLGLDTLFQRFRPDIEYSLITVLFVFGYMQSMTSLSLHVNRVLWLGFGYILGGFIARRLRN